MTEREKVLERIAEAALDQPNPIPELLAAVNAYLDITYHPARRV
jgi:hypothetical protein